MMAIATNVFYLYPLFFYQVRSFAVKLLTGKDASFRGEYMQYNLGARSFLCPLSSIFLFSTVVAAFPWWSF